MQTNNEERRVGAAVKPYAKSSSSTRIKSAVEVTILQEFARELEKRIQADKSESTWQEYFKQNILFIQQGYIELVSKANIGVVGTSYPGLLPGHS